MYIDPTTMLCPLRFTNHRVKVSELCPFISFSNRRRRPSKEKSTPVYVTYTIQPIRPLGDVYSGSAKTANCYLPINY